MLCSALRPLRRTRLLFIQEKPPNIPQYLMLDTISDTFKCLSPHPVWHKDDAQLQGKVRGRDAGLSWAGQGAGRSGVTAAV